MHFNWDTDYTCVMLKQVTSAKFVSTNKETEESTITNNDAKEKSDKVY